MYSFLKAYLVLMKLWRFSYANLRKRVSFWESTMGAKCYTGYDPYRVAS